MPAEGAWLGSKHAPDSECLPLQGAGSLSTRAPRVRSITGGRWLHANSPADTAHQSSPGCGVTRWDPEFQQVEPVSPEQHTRSRACAQGLTRPSCPHTYSRALGTGLPGLPAEHTSTPWSPRKPPVSRALERCITARQPAEGMKSAHDVAGRDGSVLGGGQAEPGSTLLVHSRNAHQAPAGCWALGRGCFMKHCALGRTLPGSRFQHHHILGKERLRVR